MYFSIPKYHKLLWLFFFYALALIIFGKTFTKALIWESVSFLYIHDVVLFFLAVYGLVVAKFRFYFRYVILIVIISIIYLVVSIYGHFYHQPNLPFILYFRQFALFIYLFFSGCIFSGLYKVSLHHQFRFFRAIGIISILIQSIWIIYVFFSDYLLSIPIYRQSYQYFSLAIVIGLIIGTPIVLEKFRGITRLIIYLWCVYLSHTTGHSSAFLAVFVIGLFYFFLHSNLKSKLIGLILSISLIASLLVLPSFRDDNVSFRLILWEYTIERIFVDNYGVIGEGFGTSHYPRPVMDELVDRVYQGTSPSKFHIPYQAYISSVHNSFLAIFLLIGFLPSLVLILELRPHLLVPLIIYSTKNNHPRFRIYFMAFIGASIWASFNVVLELPHSAVLFWGIYFLLIIELRRINSVRKI